MGCIFDEGMRQLDEAWWHSCLTCQKRVGDDHIKQCGLGVLSQKCIPDNQHVAESIMSLKEETKKPL